MTAEWFTEPEGFIAETAWGRFQDTPIFRSLAREHNVAVTHRNGGYIAYDGPPLVATLRPDEEVISKGDRSFRKALLIEAIADGGYGE